MNMAAARSRKGWEAVPGKHAERARGEKKQSGSEGKTVIYLSAFRHGVKYPKARQAASLAC